MYHAQLGRFCSRDPVAYDGGTNLFEYVSSRPIFSVDSHGLTLEILPEQVINKPIEEALGLPQLGWVAVENLQWVTVGQRAATLYSLPVPCSICKDGELFVASYTIDRAAKGTVQVFRYKFFVGGDNPDPRLVRLATGVNPIVQWEENAHQNASLRWLRDHREVGYGTGCSRPGAILMAMRVVVARVRAVEAMLLSGWRAENFAIDMLGEFRRQMLISEIMGGN